MNVLREKVDALVREQLRIEGENNNTKDEDEEESSSLVENSRRNKYAFYLCKSCKDPYFGGTIECADVNEEDVYENDQLCPSCSTATQPTLQCRNPLQHRGFHVW
eukprot:CAMPEP_0194141306 /NCGR_PEP_ID=MMETSP0152-20130528/10727_1 /TAXON_ID=1049557 /ORGANISM="Thalassiothrix antarctica, Strain L6-D1" /LENGTH=104 /DNA_ID=CAMNT_0038839877 /DNA_START=117 /DNA_END=428 /DNA_ORIENTATION=+